MTPAQERSMAMPAKALLVGTGRVAFHLGHGLKRAGLELVGVAGRSGTHVRSLAETLLVPGFILGEPLPPADLMLIAVSDDAIAPVAKEIPITTAVVVHTSGVGDLDRLQPHPDRAVLWPVISMGPGAPLDLRAVPLVIDANTERARKAVKDLADGLSDQVLALDHHRRELVHAAAAISLNLPTFLLQRAQALLQREGIDPSVLTPSFVAMGQKIATVGAAAALTGPARRGDLGTIHLHLARLADDPELRAAYARLSSMILRAYDHPDHGNTDV